MSEVPLTEAKLREVLNSMSGEMVMFESHIERMDRERQAQEAALKLERERTRNARWLTMKESLAWLFGGIAAVAIVLGITYAIWTGTRGPSATEEQEQEARLECIEHGGTWLGGTDTSDGSCVMPGVSTK